MFILHRLRNLLGRRLNLHHKTFRPLCVPFLLPPSRSVPNSPYAAPPRPPDRLNWWPTTLGGSISYFAFWSFSLLIGYLLHTFDLDGLGTPRSHTDKPPSGREKWDWERKTIWVALAFMTMTMPALACFAKLRADRRQSYRRSLTEAQKTFVSSPSSLAHPPHPLIEIRRSFLERQLAQRMPRSYKRFLWFLLTLSLSLLALVIGQGFATIYLSTLPHSNLDGLVYVWTWILTVQCLNAISHWVLMRKVRSRALVFVFRVSGMSIGSWR